MPFVPTTRTFHRFERRCSREATHSDRRML
jgi:hypothetical protein